jgi:hypothetical protein
MSLKKLKEKKWFQALTGIAPTIATALGGPFAGLAMTVLKDVTGVSDEGELEAALVGGDPTTFLALKQAENQFKVTMREMDLKEDQLLYEDIDSARKMHAAQMESTPSVLSYLSMVIFFGVVALVVTQPQFFTDNTLAQNVAYMVIGASIGWVEKAYSFWLGSSRGSKSKTDSFATLLDRLETKT